jgi:putative transposase
VAIELPRDREGSFEPHLIGKHDRRLTGVDDKVIALFARDVTIPEIQGFLKALREWTCRRPNQRRHRCGRDRSDRWQTPPLEPLHPVVDALRVNRRDETMVRSKVAYLALSVLPDGSCDMLGIWIEQTEVAKF